MNITLAPMLPGSPPSAQHGCALFAQRVKRQVPKRLRSPNSITQIPSLKRKGATDLILGADLASPQAGVAGGQLHPWSLGDELAFSILACLFLLKGTG